MGLARRRRELRCWQGPTHHRFRGHGQGRRCVRAIAAGRPGRTSTRSFVDFQPRPHVLSVEDAQQLVPRTRELSKFGPDPLVLSVNPITIAKEIPVHHHVAGCQHHASARQCGRLHDLADRSRLRDPAAAGPPRRRRTSRIGLPATRESRDRTPAGQGRSPAVVRDPDCRARLAVRLLRLIGGRR